jgi:hypothetical protein
MDKVIDQSSPSFKSSKLISNIAFDKTSTGIQEHISVPTTLIVSGNDPVVSALRAISGIDSLGFHSCDPCVKLGTIWPTRSNVARALYEDTTASTIRSPIGLERPYPVPGLWEGEMTGGSVMNVTFWSGEGAVIAVPIDEMKRR